MAVTPLQAALDVLDRADALLSLDAGTSSNLDCDVRRQALVMGVAGLDTWMHWRIRAVDLESLTRKLADLKIPFVELVETGLRSLEARRSGVDDRPMVRARKVLNEHLLRMTFQSARQWEDGFALIGVRSGLAAAAAMSPPCTRLDVEGQLNHLSHCRNLIVHEGDLRRLVRPRTVTRNEIGQTQVRVDLAWVRRFLTAVDTLV